MLSPVRMRRHYYLLECSHRTTRPLKEILLMLSLWGVRSINFAKNKMKFRSLVCYGRGWFCVPIYSSVLSSRDDFLTRMFLRAMARTDLLIGRCTNGNHCRIRKSSTHTHTHTLSTIAMCSLRQRHVHIKQRYTVS